MPIGTSVGRCGSAIIVYAAGLALPACSSGQGYPASQRGSVTQQIAFTTVAVAYGRPVARGRALFGQLVPWDSVWHPGADSATRISFNHDVLLDEHEVKAGDYSLWLIPRDGRPWTVILSRPAAWHRPYPGPSTDVVRFDVIPETLSHMESLAIYFPSVVREEAMMRIHWGETGVPVHIRAPWHAQGSPTIGSSTKLSRPGV